MVTCYQLAPIAFSFSISVVVSDLLIVVLHFFISMFGAIIPGFPNQCIHSQLPAINGTITLHYHP